MSSDDKFVHEDTNFWQVFMQEKSYLIFFPRAVKWMIITGDLLRQLKRKTFRKKKRKTYFLWPGRYKFAYNRTKRI